MADPSDTTDIERQVARLADVLIRVAAGDFSAQVPRTGDGGALDVLAYMINATAEEVGRLVSELKRQQRQLEETQAQLVHAAKLAALGELAGGIAHELNQPLTAMRLLTDMGRRKRPGTDRGLTEAQIALLGDAAERMTRIVDSVRSFARRDGLERRTIDAATPLTAALDLIHTSFELGEIVVDCRVPADPIEVFASTDQLQQVMLNLLSNARDALVSFDGARRITAELRPASDAVEYVVTDSGAGVDPKVVDRIFDPFFTTKGPGRGTGLGLSVSFGIVQAHGGSITYENAPGGGARFVVRIPREAAT